MSAITAQDVKALRDRTGAGMMACKNALNEAGGDIDAAVELLRARGEAQAAKREGREATEGTIQTYVHSNGKIGVLVEVDCETDFVARNDDFKTFVKDIAMHIAASSPQYVSRDEVPEAVVAKEREILAAQAKEEGKPDKVVTKMVEGRLGKFFKEVCLLEQPFVREPDQTVEQLLNELVAKIGEKIAVRRFIRFQLGEGIEKRKEDFASEVAKAAQG